jgi:hypothetical protein
MRIMFLSRKRRLYREYRLAPQTLQAARMRRPSQGTGGAARQRRRITL